MALWNQVQSGFDADDETINFGTRIIAENNGSVYEACTIATIQSHNEVNEKPNISASFQNSKLCVAIDHSITIFQNETCDKILCNISFPYLIANYCISNNACFLFVVLTNRVLYCLHLPDGKIICTKIIPDNQNDIINISLKEQGEELFIILITKIGAIYRYSGFFVKILEAAYINDDKAIITKHIANIQCSQLFEGFTGLEFLNATINTSLDELSIIMVGKSSIFIWPNELHNNFSSVFSFGFKKIKLLKGSNKILCLRTDHVLSMICQNTLLGLKIYDKPVFDFTIMHEDINCCNILFLTQCKNSHDMYTLCLLSYPDFEQKMEINISNTSYLLDMSDISDNIFYIEGIANENSIISTFRIKTISESIPEMRLARLLRKNQFDAAEAFAERSGLSLESIYCSKAASFIQQLSPWAKCTPASVNINILINTLDKIQNVQYVTECCSKALISNYIQMRQLYLYARERIVQNMKKENTNVQLDYKLHISLSLINDTLHRLETFQMIQDIETNLLLQDDVTMKEWIKFSQTNLLKECIAYLRMYQLQSATLIWTRHLPDIIKNISKENIQDLFLALPEDISISCLWPWLIHFIPTLLSLLPNAIDEIVSWGLKKLKYLEISHRPLWPEIGTEFAKKFIELVKFENNQHSIYFHREYRHQNSALKQLMFLFQALTEIQQLNTVYRLKVPLDIYVGSPIEAIYILLNKIHLDEIPKFVNTFLKKYILNNNLQNDSVLCGYIQNIIKNSSSWWSGEEAAWEKRVTMIIDLIHNTKNRLEQTLEVLRRAPVPWSPTIVTLAKTNSNFDHELSSKIEIECDYVKVKLVLKKYGYAAIGINNKLISRIIKEDRDSMINDIKVLTENDQQLRQDTFCRCINIRLNEGNLHKAIDIIHNLEDNINDALYCYEGIINYIVATHTLQEATTSLTYHMEILGCLEFKIHNLLTKSKICSFRCNNIINTIKNLRSLYILKKDYKVDVSYKDYCVRKTHVLQNYIIKIFADIKQDNLSLTYTTIIKIAELLGLKKSYAILSLMEHISISSDMETLLHLIADDDKELNMANDKFENINKICLSVLQHTAINTDAIQIVKDLSISALNFCQNDDIQSALLLYTRVNMWPSFPVQHSSYLKKRCMTKHNWKLYTIYEDQAISLDKRLLSLFQDAMCLHLFYSNSINSAAQDNENTNLKPQMDELLNNFLKKSKEMQFQHNDYSLLRIFKTFYIMYCSTPTQNEFMLMEMKSMLSQLLINVLKRLHIGWSFDLHLGLSCLFMLPVQEACTWISTACPSSTDHIRHSIISILGYEYSHLIKNRSLIQIFQDQKLLHIWAQQLQSHCSIPYKEVLVNDASNKRKVLQQIINSNKENVISLLNDYCYSFGFNFDDSLLLYLQRLLKTWNPTLTFFKKELCIRKDEVDELREKCDAIIAQIKDKSIITPYVTNLWEHISFYHYEVFIILMDLAADRDMQKRNLLCFLENYTRTGPPTSKEHDEWIQLNSEHSALPSIAQWRLPFLLKNDIWKVITPELNLKTYDKWLDIAPVLNLETHLICTLAVKGEITRIWGNNSANSKNTTWSLHLKNITLLEDIKKCIERIPNSDGFYYGTAALYYVVNHTPPGADRVAAANECYKYAQLAMQNSEKMEEGMLEKIKSKYLRFTSEHILRTHGLEIDKYFALIENPCELVHELYNDESIPSRYRTATDYRPDINATVNELGNLFSLNTIKLRLDLLEKWLYSNTRFTDLYQSFTDTFQIAKHYDHNYDHEDNLLRICYLLEYGDRDLFIQFLINIAFADRHDDVQYNSDVRYRTLCVLQTILDTATLEELTKRDKYTFRKYMKSLQYMSKLESLGLCYTIDTFEACSKQELIQILWKTQRRLPYALLVMTQICIDFKIYDIQFWDNILNQMTILRMVNELKKILLQIRNQGIIVNCNSYKIAWQLIISEPFKQMDLHPTLEQINNCIEAICLLYSYPMAHELDFTSIVKTCFKRRKQEYLAAALLPFLNEANKNFVLEKIKESCEITELVTDLNNLSSKGVLTIERSLIIIKKM